MIEALLSALGISLLLTLIFETGFFLLTGKRNKKDLLLVVMVNILTNPIVVLSYWLVSLFTNWNTDIIAVLLEIFAVLTEGYYYKKYSHSIKRPYLLSAAANIFSYGIGVVIQLLF